MTDEEKLAEAERLRQDIETATEMFDAGFNQVQIAKHLNTSRTRVRRLLITSGRVSTKTIEKVRQMREDGFPDGAIAKELGIVRASLTQHTPFSVEEYKYMPPIEKCTTEPTAAQNEAYSDIIPAELEEKAEELGLDPVILARAILLDWVQNKTK